ncbi:MAG: response regulator [Gammaproteobacteria bacterium]|nr:response regulator [Gammaproteobacteria bacterium]MBU1624790.1 response regulator [Gammaproteobacteria bacterium]MBU1982634.1 response regulator [Gammaproteobacteria bacterium]
MNAVRDLLKFDISEENLPIRREQIRARIAMYPTMSMSALLLLPLLVWLMWDVLPQSDILVWACLILAAHTIEGIEWFKRGNITQTLEACQRWDRNFRFHTSIVAGSWGIGWWFLFIPGDLAYQSLLICVAMGMAAGAVTINPVYRPSLFIYLGLLLLPLIFRVALENDRIHWILSLMLLIYIGFLLNSAIKLMYTFELSLTQKHEKESLLLELRQRESDLAEALAAAEQANRSKSKFLATASHDLRQPLQALRLFTEALQETAREKEPVRLAGQIGKSVDALVDMFDDLLDVSRLDAGIVEPRWQHFMLGPLLDRLYGDFAPIAQAKGLSYDMPNSGEHCQPQLCAAVVYSDPFLLERMLRNLIANAIRYTDAGGVVVHCICTGSKVEIEVVDTGIGIEQDALPHIFEEYYQAGNPHRDRRKGLGLGLTIVHRIDLLLGSELKVSSESGVGSVFSFSIVKGDASQLAQPFAISHAEYDLSGRVVALVEDDPDIRESTVELMQQWGCKVFASESADEVMRELDVAEQRPEVLVCDYRLPQGMTAIDVIRRMRERWGAGLPAVVLTGDTASETLHEIHASGAILLHKPIAPIRLRAMVYFVLTGKH